MITCSFCQTRHQANTLFCDHCGRLLSDQAKPPPKTIATAQTAPLNPRVVDPELDDTAATSGAEAPPLHLVLTTLDGKKTYRRVLQTVLTIGRNDPTNGIRPDIDLSELGDACERVSRRHAVLVRNGPLLMLKDLGSANGTYVGAKRVIVGEMEPIGFGDELRFGRVVLKLVHP
jgi:pSer/pThr/pTyr-binding forkhead associated (FHA) protein